jgi:hypothetical protein
MEMFFNYSEKNISKMAIISLTLWRISALKHDNLLLFV